VKAVVIHRHGGPDELRYEDVDDPVPGAGDIVIKALAIGVNPADYKHRDGRLAGFVDYTFPLVLGSDVAGVVVAVGQDVVTPVVGDHVAAMVDPLRPCAYAELVRVPAEYAAVIDDDIPFATAAAIPCAALTGTQMIERTLRPAAGDVVLAIGATGMVGRFAVRALKAAGAAVIAAARPSYVNAARELGADEVIAMDGNPWPGAPLDAVIDTVGGAAATALARAVKPSGAIVTVATDPFDVTVLPVTPVAVGVRPDGARLRGLVDDVAQGLVHVEVAAELPLSDAASAHEMVEHGGLTGKVILIP